MMSLLAPARARNVAVSSGMRRDAMQKQVYVMCRCVSGVVRVLLRFAWLRDADEM